MAVALDMKRTTEIAQTTSFPNDCRGVSPTEQAAAGKAVRDKVPRQEHRQWSASKGRPDPIDLLRKSDAGRLNELIAIRYGRMLESPFAFYRGAAGVMAADL